MRRSIVSALAAAFVAVPLAAGATLIVPVSQARSVSASASVTGGQPSSSSFSASDFGPWDQTATAGSSRVNPSGTMTNSVRQRSTIGESSLSSEIDGGMLRTEFGGGSGSTQSVFDVTFDLTGTASYKLANGLNQSSLIGHVVTLYDVNGQVIAQPIARMFPVGYPDAYDLMGLATGVLGAGRYRLTVQWNRNGVADFGPDSTFDGVMNLAFTPIPEPGTVPLFVLGLGALAARRQRA